MSRRRSHRALRRRFGHAGAYVFEFEYGGRRVVIAHNEGAGSYEARIYTPSTRPWSRIVRTLTGKTADEVEEKAKKAIDGGLT